MWGQVMKKRDYYLIDYRVPQGVHDDSLLTSGSSMFFSVRCVESTHNKILCDDVYQPHNIKLTGTWPEQKMVRTTYAADSTGHYSDPLSLDYRGYTFELTLSYIHSIQPLHLTRVYGARQETSRVN